MKHEITDWASHKVEKRKIKSATWNVYGVDQYRFQVFDGRYNREVNLASRTCDCRKWQHSGIPCGHVIAVSRFLGQNTCVQYVQDWFKKAKYQATYAEAVNFVGEFHEWEYPTNIQPIKPPRMDNPQPGRPKNTNRIRSQGEEPRLRHCGRCGEAGHTRGQCKQPFVPEEMLTKRKQYPRKKKPVNDQQQTPPLFDSHPSQTDHHTVPTYDTYPSHVFGHNTFPTQPYNQNFYTTGQYDQGQASHEQHGHHNPAHGYEQYNSQPYPSQHLNDLNTQQSNNSWFNFFG